MLVVVVGCGGTGSYAIPDIYSVLASTGQSHTLLLIDGDRVEERNLQRQAFYLEDIGENKAMCMLNRLRQVGVSKTEVVAYPHFVRDVSGLLQIVNCFVGDYSDVVFVCCADNTTVRARIENAALVLRNSASDLSTVVMLDSGNSEWTGQCLVSVLTPSTTVLFDDENRVVGVENALVYDSLLARLEGSVEDRLTYGDFELSCADNVEAAPQNISINIMAASVLVNSLITILYKGVANSMSFESKMGTCLILERPSLESVNEWLNLFSSSSHYDTNFRCGVTELEFCV